MEEKKVAVFIDAENVSYKAADKIFSEAKSYGDVIIKKIYGDWSKNNLVPWKDVIEKYSIVAEQQFTFAKGKNSCDIALMIHALCAVFEKNIDIFCLATADSDFTRLVQELKERQKTVVGFGGRNAIPSLVNAFNSYIYLDDESQQPVESDKIKPKKRKTSTGTVLGKDKTDKLTEIIDVLIESSQKAYLSQVSNEMKKQFSDFIPKNYGAKSMKELFIALLKTLNRYEMKTDSDGKSLYIAKKQKQPGTSARKEKTGK